MSKRNTEKRIKAVEMQKQGLSRRHIAETSGVSPDSVKTWTAMYKNGQEDLLEENAKVRLYSQRTGAVPNSV